jgi:hypothetical protein
VRFFPAVAALPEDAFSPLGASATWLPGPREQPATNANPIKAGQAAQRNAFMVRLSWIIDFKPSFDFKFIPNKGI